MTTSDTIAGKIIKASKTKAAKLPYHEQMQKLSCGLAYSSFVSNFAAERRHADRRDVVGVAASASLLQMNAA